MAVTPPAFGPQDEALAVRLCELASDEALDIRLGDQRFVAPLALDELASAVLEDPEATILAGGTDVGLWVTKRRQRLKTLISLARVEELKRIEIGEEEVWIGGAVRYVDAWEALALIAPAFEELLRRLGGPQVRDLGTVCGNIANGSPIGDMPPALIVLGASLVLRQGQERRTLPLETFFLDYGVQDRRPGEFIEAVVVPKVAKDCLFKIYKVSKRFDQDISAVCAGLAITVRGGEVAEARIAFGGMAGTPRRARACEAFLVGKAWTLEAVRAAGHALDQDFQPISDMRASSDYRRRVAKGLLVRAFLDSVDLAPVGALTAGPVAYG